MVEALIVCALVLVPLFLAIPVIAKYLDLRSHVVQGARYAAWERTIWYGGAAAAPMGIGSLTNQWEANEKSDADIRTEIGARLLSNQVGAFSNTDHSGSGYLGGPKLFWEDRRGTSLLRDYSDLGGSVDNNLSPGIINDLLNPVVQITSVISSFTVDTHADYTAKVGLNVRQVAINPGAGLGACPGCPVEFLATSNVASFAEQNTLVANGWNANGPGSLDASYHHPEQKTVLNQVRGLTPSALLKPTGGPFADAMKVLNAIALVFFPELSTLDLGRVDVDRVPDDRLQ